MPTVRGTQSEPLRSMTVGEMGSACMAQDESIRACCPTPGARRRHVNAEGYPACNARTIVMGHWPWSWLAVARRGTSRNSTPTLSMQDRA
eukprot:365608-Chlamydomonas_euryale.AAC.2